MCILSAQHKTVPTRMRVVRKYQQQRWGLVDSSLFLTHWSCKHLVPLLDPPRILVFTNHKGGWKGAFAAPLTFYEITQNLLVLAPFLCEWRGPSCAESWKYWNGKGFSPRTWRDCFTLLDMFKSGWSPRGEKIGLQSSSSTPLTPYLSNLTKTRKTEGNKRQSYSGNLKLLKQNGKHMK